MADVSSNITHDKRLPRIHFLQIQVKTPKYTILKHTFHFTTTLPLFFLRLLPHKDPEHNNKKTTLNSMSYEIWEIWSQEPCLVLDWKILPRAWKDIGDVAIYFDCYLFCRLHFSHCTCINIALNFGSAFKRAIGTWLRTTVSQNGSLDLHLAYQLSISMCMISQSHLKMWKMPIVDGSKRVTIV